MRGDEAAKQVDVGASQNDRDLIVDAIRTAIKTQIDGEDLNLYALTKRLKNRVGARTIYDFMAGNAEINVGALADILNALDLEIVIAPRRGTGYQVKAKWLGVIDPSVFTSLYEAFIHSRNRNGMRY